MNTITLKWHVCRLPACVFKEKFEKMYDSIALYDKYRIHFTYLNVINIHRIGTMREKKFYPLIVSCYPFRLMHRLPTRKNSVHGLSYCLKIPHYRNPSTNIHNTYINVNRYNLLRYKPQLLLTYT
jgi:hypothetical protein